MARDEKERAKRIIFEIIRQAGGVLENKTNLYKAFWKAHLSYAERNLGYLSGWPIIRMPNGPGIDRFEVLIGEMLAEELISLEQVQRGEFQAFVFRTAKDATPSAPITDEDVAAIREGVESVRAKSARAVSEESHLLSRSWREGANGEEQDIYLDLMTDDEYAALTQEAQKMSLGAEKLWT